MILSRVALGLALAAGVSGFAPLSSYSPSLSRNGLGQSTSSAAAPLMPRLRLGGRPAQLNMVAAERIDTNPLRPKEIPYSIISKLPEEFAWIVPDDKLSVKERIAKYVAEGSLKESDMLILVSWLDNFKDALINAPKADAKDFCVEDYFSVLTELIKKERARPHYFNEAETTGTHYEKYNSHHADSPFFDYQKFGCDVTRPLIDWENSQVLGAANFEKIKAQLAAGDNVVLCSNHQSESDTHCIFTVMEDQLGPAYGEIAKNMVFIAGERVLRDAIVVPFSRGCSLLTVYSKKHIDSEPELKMDKMNHNGKTMKQLGAFFHKGGTCMWFAPSGGRDRRSADTGKVELSPFDANSIEMMRQVATQAGVLERTHFYAMALATHNIFPPPSTVGGAFVEERCVNFSAIRMALSEEVGDVPVDTSLEGAELKKAIKASRVTRAENIFNLMKEDYEKIRGYEQ